MLIGGIHFMYDILLYITFFAGLLPLVIYLILKKRKDLDDEFRGILPFLWLTAFACLYEPIVTIALKVDATYWFRTYNVLEFLCLYYFFRHSLPFQRYKSLFIFSLLLFVGGGIAVYVTDMGQLLLESLYAPFIFLYIILFSAIWIWEMFITADLPSLWKNPLVYFISGFVFYFAATFFFYLFCEVIYELHSFDYSYYWLLNIAATLILNIFLITGIWNGRNI